jgi:hypothetical protein
MGNSETIKGMEMKIEDRLLIKNLASTASLVNGINGGMVQPIVQLEKSEGQWIERIRIPGVSVDNVRIEVKEGILFVFQNLFVEGMDIELPYMVEMLNLSSQIDQEQIYAEFDNREIIIHMPFDEFADGFEREIEIIRR